VDYILGLGSNLGSRQANLQAGLSRLQARADCRLTRVSSLYETDPVGPPQPRYLNAAARLESTLPARALLSVLHEIEAQLGRERREHWGPRTLDIDILWAAEPVQCEDLQVPHPRLCERSFALVPLLEVAPELAHLYGPALATLARPMLVQGSWHRAWGAEEQRLAR
jgi:2-amino-4-hydroxy-6-hydroxymethyldihydropteridine diphosphokinase